MYPSLPKYKLDISTEIMYCLKQNEVLPSKTIVAKGYNCIGTGSLAKILL